MSGIKRLMCLLVRQNFSNECEKALNKQIQLELRACNEYLAMAYHFDRSDVAMPGVHRYFKRASDEEREHAEKLMQYMNKRGGQIVIEALPAPKCDYMSAMEALQDALRLEKTVNESLLNIHTLAAQVNDPALCDFIEANFLQEQINAQKELSDLITQLERADKKLGDFLFDEKMKQTELH